MYYTLKCTISNRRTSGGVYVSCMYMHTRWVTVGDSGFCCCACVTSFERWLTPLCVDVIVHSFSSGHFILIHSVFCFFKPETEWLLTFWNKIQTQNRFKRTLIYLSTDTHYVDFRGNPLYQASKRHLTDKRSKPMKSERKRLIKVQGFQGFIELLAPGG